jgi:GYF domain 2
MKFFAWLNDQEQGPFDEENIQTMIASGQIPNDTLLRLEDNDSDWIAAKDLFPQDSSGVQRLKLNEIDLVEIELNSGTKLKIKSICPQRR